MMTDPHLMPDFRDSLEQALYRRASLPAAAPAPGRFRLPTLPRVASWRAGFASAAIATVAAIALVFASADHPGGQVVADPLILHEPTVPVPNGVLPGTPAQRTLGADVRYERAVPFDAVGATGFLLEAKAGWCLLAPDGTVDLQSASVQCARNDQLRRIGMATLSSAGSVVAVVPPSAAAPTLLRRDGTSSTLVPSKLGVVVSDGVRPGDTVVLHGIDGSEQRLTLPLHLPTKGGG